MDRKTDKIILGGGCFWCVEAAMQLLPGVVNLTSGYAGGKSEHPNYASVCSGTTGHAEVVLVEWDIAEISLTELLAVFFQIHDPTSLNRQGNDVGTQYRSCIGYFGDEQRQTVETFINDQAARYHEPIVTELLNSPVFYAAEAEHQDYYRRHPYQGYCQLVIKPKLNKLKH